MGKGEQAAREALLAEHDVLCRRLAEVTEAFGAVPPGDCLEPTANSEHAGSMSLGHPFFAHFLANLPVSAYVKNRLGLYVYVNDHYCHLLGRSQEELLGRHVRELWPQEASQFEEDDLRVLETGELVRRNLTVHQPGGESFEVFVTKFPMIQGGTITGVGGFVLDVSEAARAEKARRESERLYRTMMDYAYDCESWMGPDGTLIYINPACERLTGYPRDRFLNDPDFLHSLVHRDDLPGLLHYKETSLEQDGRSPDFRIFRSDGRMRWLCMVSRVVRDESGASEGVRYSVRDITDRKFMEKQLEYEALHDPLTGLPNRILCRDRLERAMERAQRRADYYFAVVFMDLDRFKIINDSMGHSFGDIVLQEVSQRLLKSVRDLDTVSRFGGDEFVLLLEELKRPREAVRIIKRIRTLLAQPLVVHGREIRLSACYGLLLSPVEVRASEELVQNANIALHRAKEAGPNHVKVYNFKMLDHAMRLLTLEADMRRAIGTGDFRLAYQPIYSIKDQRLIGFEALVRWRHAERGELSPVEFIPVAEESGLIHELGDWVLEEACRTMARWRSLLPGAEGLLMSVNVSGKQFNRYDIVDRVRAALRHSGLAPEALKLEITESTVMEDAENAVEKLRQIKRLGVKVSVDDFGTGYSSMSYLQRFPLDHLKIDLSFVQGMDSSNENMEIVKAIINLAHSLGLKVIAEGVEREAHSRLLDSLDCEYGQGFFYSHPLCEDDARSCIDRGCLFN